MVVCTANSRVEFSETDPIDLSKYIQLPQVEPEKVIKEKPMRLSLFNAIMGQGKLRACDAIDYFKYCWDSRTSNPSKKAQIKCKPLSGWAPFENQLQEVSSRQKLIALSDDLFTSVQNNASTFIRGGYGTSQAYLRQSVEADEYSNWLGTSIGQLTFEKLSMLPDGVKEAIFEHVYHGKMDELADAIGDLLRGLFPSEHLDQMIDVVVDGLKQGKTLEQSLQKGFQTAFLSELDETQGFASELLTSFSPQLVDSLKKRGIASQEQPVWYQLDKLGLGYQLYVYGIEDGEVVKLTYNIRDLSKELLYQLLAFRKMPQLSDVSYSFDSIRTYLDRNCLRISEYKNKRFADQLDEQRLILCLIDDQDISVNVDNIRVKAKLAEKEAMPQKEKFDASARLPKAVKNFLQEFVVKAGISPEYIEIARMCIERSLGADAVAAVDAMCNELLPNWRFLKVNTNDIGLVERFLEYRIDHAKGFVNKTAWQLAELTFKALSLNYLPEQMALLAWHLELQLAKIILPIIAQVYVWAYSAKDKWTKDLISYKETLTREGNVDFTKGQKDVIKHFLNPNSPIKVDIEMRGDRAYIQGTQLFISAKQWVDTPHPFSNYLVLEDSFGDKNILVRENLNVSASMNLIRQLTGIESTLYIDSTVRNLIQDCMKSTDDKDYAMIRYELKNGKIVSDDAYANAYLVFSYLTQGKIALAEQAFDMLKACTCDKPLSKEFSPILQRMLPLVFLLKDRSAYVLQLKMLALCQQMNLTEELGMWDYLEFGAVQGIMEYYLSKIKNHQADGLSIEEEKHVLEFIKQRGERAAISLAAEGIIPSSLSGQVASLIMLPEIKKKLGWRGHGPLENPAKSFAIQKGFQKLDQRIHYSVYDRLTEAQQEGDAYFSDERLYSASSLMHMFSTFYLQAKKGDAELGEVLRKLRGIGTYHPTAAMIHDVLLDVIDCPDLYPEVSEVCQAFLEGEEAVRCLFKNQLLGKTSVGKYWTHFTAQAIEALGSYLLIGLYY
ncbi:MAG: hypothetical protein KDK50_03190 [Chlamydiia bacterium]|nr:hypothetical protein [Chlamydiia bacterium]